MLASFQAPALQCDGWLGVTPAQACKGPCRPAQQLEPQCMACIRSCKKATGCHYTRTVKQAIVPWLHLRLDSERGVQAAAKLCGVTIPHLGPLGGAPAACSAAAHPHRPECSSLQRPTHLSTAAELLHLGPMSHIRCRDVIWERASRPEQLSVAVQGCRGCQQAKPSTPPAGCDCITAMEVAVQQPHVCQGAQPVVDQQGMCECMRLCLRTTLRAAERARFSFALPACQHRARLQRQQVSTQQAQELRSKQQVLSRAIG